MLLSLEIGKEREFAGVYVLHWEVTRFVVAGTPRFFGLFRPTVRCLLEIPEGVHVPWRDEWEALRPNWRGCPGLAFNVKLTGVVVEKGNFGHMGICRYKIKVHEIIKAEKYSGGPRW